jgi:hypothetical protein
MKLMVHYPLFQLKNIHTGVVLGQITDADDLPVPEAPRDGNSSDDEFSDDGSFEIVASSRPSFATRAKEKEVTTFIIGHAVLISNFLCFN